MNDDQVGAREAAFGAAAPRASGAILVATKGSPRCRDALDWAAAEADARGCMLRVVHAVAWPTMAADALCVLPVDRLAAAMAAGESILDDAVGRARAVAPAIKVVGQLEVGNSPAGAIARALTNDRLIVLGRRRVDSRLLRRYSRSTAAQVARRTACPVAVIGLLDEAVRPDGRVAAVVDSRAGSAEALDFAIRAAERRGVDVVVIRVGESGRAEFETAGEARASGRRSVGEPSVFVRERWLACSAALVAEAAGAGLIVLSQDLPRSVRRALFGRIGRSARSAGLGPVVLVRKDRDVRTDS